MERLLVDFVMGLGLSEIMVALIYFLSVYVLKCMSLVGTSQIQDTKQKINVNK